MADEHWHSKFIELLAAELKPAVYVELGISVCETINRVSPLAKHVWCCDVQDFRGQISHGHNVDFFHENTGEFAKRWNKDIRKEIDLIFIDADHSREAVLHDVQAFYPWLKPDTGIMVLHDMWPPTKELTDVRRCGNGYGAKGEIFQNVIFPDGEMLTIPAQYGLTLIRKKGYAWQN